MKKFTTPPKNLWIKIFLTTASLLTLDLLTKYFFYNQKIFPELFTPAFNTGISWSLPVPYWIIYCIAWGAILALSYLVIKKQLSRYVFAFFLAGTLGNLIDRIWLGGVRDFILVFDWFPVFNIADVLLNIAIIMRIGEEIFN